jgi:hypothetical protein
MSCKTVALSLAAALAAAPLLAQEPEPKIGARIASFEMRRAKRTPDEVARLAAAVAELLGGEKTKAVPSVTPLRSRGGSERRWLVALPDGAELRMRYIPETDELRALNREVMADGHPEKDIGQAAALEVAQRAFRQLAAARVVDERHFDLKQAEIASTWVGEGTTDGRVNRKRLVEYRVTWRRRLNGIDFANAGLRVAVHASGRLSGLRLGGVDIASEASGAVENPKGRGQWLTRKVEPAAIERRFRRDAAATGGQPDVKWARVMYVMPEGRSEAVVEPLQVYSYSLRFKTDGGEVVSRRQVLGYSLIDPAAPPIDLVPPTRAPREGDAKPASAS